MSNIFSFDRFLKVLKYDFKFRVPAIGSMFLVFLVLPHALHLIMNYGGSFATSTRIDTIGTILFCLLFFAPFSIYSAFREKHGLSSFIMIPASSLEKFASMVTISFVAVPLAFCVCSYVTDVLFALIFKASYGGFISMSQIASGADILNTLVVVFSLVGASVLGNVIFKKKASAKTILCLLALAFLWGVGVTGYIFDNLFADGNVDAKVAQAKAEQLKNITSVVLMLVSVLFYCLALWRIKKIQIS